MTGKEKMIIVLNLFADCLDEHFNPEYSEMSDTDKKRAERWGININKAGEMVRVLRRVIQECRMEEMFGETKNWTYENGLLHMKVMFDAPGKWGYDTAMGQALYEWDCETPRSPYA